MPALARTSRRLALATGTVINKAKYDSENYQIMNYGLGGSILVHKDVDDPDKIDESFSVSIISPIAKTSRDFLQRLCTH